MFMVLCIPVFVAFYTQSLRAAVLNAIVLNTIVFNIIVLNIIVVRATRSWLRGCMFCVDRCASMVAWSRLKACKTWLFLVFSILWVGCSSEPDFTKVTALHRLPSQTLRPGTHALNLGATLFINREFAWRDGLLHVPRYIGVDKPAPLLVWLHGGGVHAHHVHRLLPAAEKAGVVVLALDSRHNTWDGIDSPFGPDVRFIAKALEYTFDHVWIAPGKIALGGLSDGASYALALGRVNGDLFTHLIAVAPWRLKPPAAVSGAPDIFVTHGKQDNIYPYWHSRYFVVPALQKAGYAVDYLEFNGPHSVTPPVSEKIMQWFVDTPTTVSESTY